VLHTALQPSAHMSHTKLPATTLDTL
jgi:hypothetical protein